MERPIRSFMLAGMGGLITYAVARLVITTFVTGTSSADTLVKTIVPIVIGAGVVWLIVVSAFSG